jgi:hypothetical protein
MADSTAPASVTIDVATDGTALLDVTEIGRFLIRGGRRVSVEPRFPLDEPAVRLYLLGSVLAMLSYQRGLVPLHACCLILTPDTTDGSAAGAVVIAGDSGVGKSTLAATLALQGVPILADDVCVVDTIGPGEPIVWPSIARLKLWRDTVERLGIPVDSVECVRQGFEKYALRDIPIFRTEPTRLAAVYHLTRGIHTDDALPEAVGGLSAVTLIHHCVYRFQIGRAMGLDRTIARALISILATTPVFQVSHDPTNSAARPLAERLIEHRHMMMGLTA